uniref:Splicing factor n=1 Tax=Tanacetum cinerariifolium TaxID=118510 RepID=A0A6L2MVF5_TANCI|nr:splicing factor [Tanacetum cinerariifolium]
MMPGRPQKSRIKDPCETSDSHTSRVGRTMTCTNYWQKGHNKESCKADPSPKSPVEKKPPGRNKQSAVGTRGRGRRGRGMKSSVWGEEVMVEEYQLQLDEEAFRECMEEQAREQAKNDDEQEREDSLEEAPFNHTNAKVLIPSIHSQPTQQSGVWVKDTTDVTTEDVDEFPGIETSEITNVAKKLSTPAVDKGKGVASVVEQDNAPKKKRGRPPSHMDGVRVYHKNRKRSKRIAKMKEKKAFKFDKHGTCSTSDKAFDVSE